MHWHRPVTSALRRQRPEEHQEFGASLIYIATLSQQNKTRKKGREKEKDSGALNTKDCPNSERLLYCTCELPCLAH